MKPFCSLLLSIFITAFYAQEQNSAIGFYTTGLEHYNHQNYKDAIAKYTKAIELNPNFAEAFFNVNVQNTIPKITKEPLMTLVQAFIYSLKMNCFINKEHLPKSC